MANLGVLRRPARFHTARAVAETAGVVTAMLLLGARAPASAEPRGAALEGWRAYEALIEARYSAAAAAGAAPFFVQDRLPDGNRWRARALGGGATAAALDPPDVPGGKIHHWAGAVFVPGVTLDRLLDVLQARAGTERRYFEDVVDSKLLARNGNRLRVFMKLRRKTVLTVTYNTEHAVDYRRIGEHRASSRSIATRIAELAAPGTAAEREKPPGSDRGFLWRLNAYWRYEDAAGGVLIECESLSLSRSVPALARPIVSPIVDRVARESLLRTLQALRASLAGTVSTVPSGSPAPSR